MKKFFYSIYLKIFAVLLFLTGLTLGVVSGIWGAQLILENEDYVYDFGSEPEDSYFLRFLAGQPERAVLGACWEFSIGDHTEPTYTEDPWEPTVSTNAIPVGEDLMDRIKQRLEELPYEGKVEYYVNLNGRVFTNTPLTKPESLMGGLYKYYAIDGNGNVEFHGGRPSYAAPYAYDYNLDRLEIDSLTIVSKISDKYVSEYRTIWQRQEKILYTAGSRILFCVLGFLASLIYLICVCGRDAEGNKKSLWTDRIWAEFHLAAMGGIGFGGVWICAVVLDAAFRKEVPMDGAYLICTLVAPLTGALILSSLLSLLRNLKAGMFAKRCGILMILKLLLHWLWAFCKWAWGGIRSVWRTLASAWGIPHVFLQIGLLLLYTGAAVFLVLLMAQGEELALVFLFLLFGVGVFFLVRKGEDLWNIQKGAEKIRSGDLSHRISEPKSPNLKPLAEDVNQIAKGLDASLAGRLKAERMKTELITNVSHDLKTPLTSMINYTELLSKVEDLPEEARDYIRIIGDKSQRLKNLTQDLFAISKVQSGNEEVNWELLDAAILLEQSLAEERGEDDKLQFCLKAEEGLTFMGDGRKLSRVMGNLIQNAVKYAMPGTRVFLSAYKQEENIVIECKNTSAYPLDFSPEEVLGRFVRGDSSRTTEGNGLGLPIAKSYTELCGGDFRLLLDGDLFKVLLSFPLTK